MIRYLVRRRQLATAVSAVADVALMAAKLALGLSTGSLGLVSDAVHSALDTVASILAFLAVRTAGQPADRDHPFGHGKAENLAAYTEGLLLVVAALVIGYQALQRLAGHPPEVDAAPIALGFLALTVVLEAGRSSVLRLVARASGSPSIEGLAADKLADLLSVSAVLIGLASVRLGFSYGDSFAALVVAMLILAAAIRLIRKAVGVLMDRSVSAVEERVLEAAQAVRGVREVKSARVRRSGTELIGDLEISGRPTLALEAAHGLAEKVREAVGHEVPGLNLSVYVASGADPTQLVERVHAIVARYGSFRDVHDVVVEREADDSLHLSLHAKLPGSMSMREATLHAHAVEREIEQELTDASRIDLHLEPLEPDIVHGRDVTGQHPDLVAGLRAIVSAEPRVLSCDDVELSSRAGEITAYIKVTVPDDLTLEQGHDIETALEETISRELPGVKVAVVRALS